MTNGLRIWTKGVARRAGRRLRGFRRAKDGSVAIEYVFLGPVFFLLMFGILEIALISMSVTGLKVGLDDVSRTIRVGDGQCLTDANVETILCNSALIPACASSVSITRQRFDSGPGADAVTVDEWSDLGADDIVMLSADYDWPVINPLLIPFLGDGNGAMSVRGAVVFKSETFNNVVCP